MRERSFVRFLLMLAATVAGGCATQIIPPAHPPRATTVYLCDYGVHSSLLLPCGDEEYVEYVYGDWDFAALNETDPLHTLQALFHSPQAALGRRFLRADSGAGMPVPPNHPHRIQAVRVDAKRVQAIVADLDMRYRRQLTTAWFNDEPNYDFLFVKDAEHYGLFNNCNTLTGHELSEMGCTICGRSVLSRFDVIAPPPQHASSPPATQPTSVITMDAAAQ